MHGGITADNQRLDNASLTFNDSRQAFQLLPSEEQDDVIEFLKTLQVLPPGTHSLVIDENGKPKAWPPRSH